MINDFTFSAFVEVSQHGKGAYYYVMVPHHVADVLNNAPVLRGGFGSIKCKATIGKTVWTTSVFPSDGLFLLLVAKKIIMSEGFHAGDKVEVTLSFSEF